MADRDYLPLPLTLDEIDSGWLTRALRTQAPGVSVLKSNIIELIGGTSTKVRLALELDDAGRRAGIPSQVILKGGFESHSRGMYHMHLKEVRSYRDVVSALGLRSPGCYFAEVDEERQQGIVIIEDLSARGVEFCHPLKPQTREQVLRRLGDLARFHAQTWDSAEFGAGQRWGWLNQALPEGRNYFDQFMEPGVWERYISAPQAASASVHFLDSGWMGDALRRAGALAARLPHAALHGDTHLGNLYVDVDGVPGFFDSQPHRGPAMLEVTYHIGGALDPMDRRRWEVDLVSHYLSVLRENGVDAPSLDEAMSHYAAFLAFGYCIFLVNESFFQPSAINAAYIARFSAAMIDNNTTSVLKAITL